MSGNLVANDFWFRKGVEDYHLGKNISEFIGPLLDRWAYDAGWNSQYHKQTFGDFD